jgi:hypothetical protein
MQNAEEEKSGRHQDHDEDNNYGVESLNDIVEAAFAPKSPERSLSPSYTASGKKRTRALRDIPARQTNLVLDTRIRCVEDLSQYRRSSRLSSKRKQ